MAGKEMKQNHILFCEYQFGEKDWHVVHLSGWLFHLEAPAVTPR